MRLTVNQVEHILERWHRLRRGNQVHFGSSDPTRLTVEARREAQQYVQLTQPLILGSLQEISWSASVIFRSQTLQLIMQNSVEQGSF